MFYRRHDLLYRIGLFYCAAPLSGAFGGLLATGLAQIKHGGYNRTSSCISLNHANEPLQVGRGFSLLRGSSRSFGESYPLSSCLTRRIRQIPDLGRTIE